MSSTDRGRYIECPHCERLEEFTHEFTARAWLTGHIQEAHGDELPDYSSTASVGRDE